MCARALPESLISVLAGARALELTASGSHRERSAREALGVLLLAAYRAGWRQTGLAAVVGLGPTVVQQRISVAARKLGSAPAGIVVDVPTSQVPSAFTLLRRPAVELEWLSVGEAAEHVGRSEATVRNWLARGVLPNTDRRSRGVYLYLRADLNRVVSAPRRGRRGLYPDFKVLRAAIAASPV